MQSDLVVTTPAASQDLLALETLRSELDIRTDDSDVKLARWISEVSAQIGDFCGRAFRLETLTETFWSDSLETEPCILTRSPVASITSVVENGETIASDNYRLRGRRLWRLSSNSMIAWSTVGEIVVVYQAGYSAVADVPLMLQRACLSLVRDRWISGQRDDALKVEQVEVPGVETVRNEYFDRSVSKSTGTMPANIEDMLVNFRDIMV